MSDREYNREITVVWHSGREEKFFVQRRVYQKILDFPDDIFTWKFLAFEDIPKRVLGHYEDPCLVNLRYAAKLRLHEIVIVGEECVPVITGREVE